MGAVNATLAMLFSPKGRIRRRDWWIWSVGVTVVYATVYVIYALKFGWGPQQMSAIRDGNATYLVLMPPFVWTCVTQYANFCLLAKRWHDCNRPAVWAALANILSLLTLMMQLYLPGDAVIGQGMMAGVVRVAYWGISLWALAECGFVEGSKGSNRYGPSQKSVGGQADVF